jgi:hypothetical protein
MVFLLGADWGEMKIKVKIDGLLAAEIINYKS